jgi:hypothetical protein
MKILPTGGACATAVTALAIAAFLCIDQASAESKRSAPRLVIPVVMEAATVRGKIVMLEDRRNDRQVLQGLKVVVWSTKSSESEEAEPETDILIHEAVTDEFGMFDLPLLEEGTYVLVIGEMNLQLVVIPKSEDRADQKEPKVLLILVPKEVVPD